MSNWISIREAAILAGRAPQNIYTWINKGKLQSRRNAQGQLEVNGIDVLRVEATVKPGRPRGSVSRRGWDVYDTPG